MARILTLLLLLPAMVFSQEAETVVKEGAPSDLKEEKIIILKHSKIEVTADKKGGREAKYIYLRQTNHNQVVGEANEKLAEAAMEYPYGYAIASKSSYEALLKAGYKYVLDSKAYDYEHVSVQPNEGELIIFEYFLRDIANNVAYKVFELDEMKIYDSKLLIKKLNKAVRKAEAE
mgnify:CR=1 FL=1